MSRTFIESLANGRRQSPARAFNSLPFQSRRIELNEVVGYAQMGKTLQGVIDYCNALPWPPAFREDTEFRLGAGGYHSEYDGQSPIPPYNYFTVTRDTYPESVLWLTLSNIIYNAMPQPWFTWSYGLISFWLDWVYFDSLLSVTDPVTAPYYHVSRSRIRTRPAFPCRIGNGQIYGNPPTPSFPLGYIGVRNIVFDSDELVIGNRNPVNLVIPENDGSIGRVKFLVIGLPSDELTPLPGLHLFNG